MTFRFDGDAIARATVGTVVRPGPSGPIWTDTRTLAPGAWFVALRGVRFDAHRFLDAARELGVAGAVVDQDVPGWPLGLVQVADTTRALQDLGRAARAQFGGRVVGITGSAGKTTTRAFTALACRPLGAVHQTVGNLNNHLGVPLTLLACPPDAAVDVVEMGTSAPGEIGFLAELATPDVRLIVNVGAAHLEELGGLDGVAVEKGALFRTAQAGDVVCVNLDDARVAAVPIPAGVRRVTFGAAAGADIRLVSAVLLPDTLCTQCHFSTPEGALEVQLPAPGAHLALNAAGALAVAYALGAPLAASAEALASYEPVGMRMRAEPLVHGAIALNDAYNANPTSTAASLRLLASLPGRRVAVIGDMLELGPGEGAFHDDIAALARDLTLDLVVLVGPRMAAAAASCPAAWVSPDGETVGGRSLADALRNWLRPGDRVLFKGSRGARVERVLDAVRGTSDSGAH